MKTLIATALLTLGFSSFQAQAHEGHDQIPGAVKALHGGVVKTGKEFNVEMLAVDQNVEFFVLAHEGESIDMKAVKLTATGKSPKGKAQEIKLENTGKSFKGTLDFQGSYRLDVEVKTEYQGKIDLYKFLAEK